MPIQYIFINILVYAGIAFALYLIFIFAKSYYLKRKNFERSMNMVFLQIKINKKESKEEQDQEQSSGAKDFKEAIGIGAQMFDSLHSIYNGNKYSGEDFISLEYVVIEDQIYFYFVVPQELTTLVEKQITGYYPEANIKQVEEFNIFKENSKVAAKALTLKKHFMYPIKSFQRLNADPINNLTNALSKLSFEDGAAIQIMMRPIDKWQKEGRDEAKNLINNKPKKKGIELNPLKILANFINFFMATSEKKDSSLHLPAAPPWWMKKSKL